MEKFDVIGIGASLYDIIMGLDAYPEEDTKVRAETTVCRCGGPTATALCAMSRLGLRAAYVGTMADDGYSDAMREDFEKYGVDFSHTVVKCDRKSPFSLIITSKSAGTRTVVWTKGTLPETKPDELPYELIKNARVLHLDGNHMEASLAAAKFARENGVKVSIDAGKLYPGMDELVEYADYFIASREFSKAYSGIVDMPGASRKMLKKTHAEVAVITDGKRGGCVRDGESYREYPVIDVEVTDTTGCGDVFHGAFIAALLRGMGYVGAAYFSSAVSSMKCRKPGGRDGIPDFDEAAGFIRARPDYAAEGGLCF